MGVPVHQDNEHILHKTENENNNNNNNNNINNNNEILKDDSIELNQTKTIIHSGNELINQDSTLIISNIKKENDNNKSPFSFNHIENNNNNQQQQQIENGNELVEEERIEEEVDECYREEDDEILEEDASNSNDSRNSINKINENQSHNKDEEKNVKYMSVSGRKKSPGWALFDSLPPSRAVCKGCRQIVPARLNQQMKRHVLKCKRILKIHNDPLSLFIELDHNNDTYLDSPNSQISMNHHHHQPTTSISQNNNTTTTTNNNINGNNNNLKLSNPSQQLPQKHHTLLPLNNSNSISQRSNIPALDIHPHHDIMNRKQPYPHDIHYDAEQDRKRRLVGYVNDSEFYHDCMILGPRRAHSKLTQILLENNFPIRGLLLPSRELHHLLTFLNPAIDLEFIRLCAEEIYNHRDIPPRQN